VTSTISLDSRSGLASAIHVHTSCASATAPSLKMRMGSATIWWRMSTSGCRFWSVSVCRRGHRQTHVIRLDDVGSAAVEQGAEVGELGVELVSPDLVAEQVKLGEERLTSSSYANLQSYVWEVAR
jgi:hypothetical protein